MQNSLSTAFVCSLSHKIFITNIQSTITPMPPKRVNTPSSPSSKKQRVAHSEHGALFSSTVNLVLELQDDATQEKLAIPFIKLPSKKLYPDYYQIIQSPISISDIQKKIHRSEYATPADFVQDFQLLLDNAAIYNDPESWIVSSARKIVDFVEAQVAQYESGPKSLKLKLKNVAEDSELTYDKLLEVCSQVIRDIMNHQFPEGVLAAPFIEDVDTDTYPDYLDFVATPTSFSNVLDQIERKKLFSPKASISDNLQAFYDATVQIFTNAQQYNDPSSDIHQDSIKLHEYFDQLYGKLDPSKKLKLKLKPKVKLSIKLKHDDKKRKREPREVKQELEESVEPAIERAPEPELEKESKVIIVEKSNAFTLGKSQPSVPIKDCFIQETTLSSSLNVVSNITQHTQQRAHQHLNLPLPKNQEVKRSLFPTQLAAPLTTFFEYKIPANGYVGQSYTVALPTDVLPFATFKVSLHKLLYDIKKDDLINGHGFMSLTSDEDFQCKLFVNDEEVSNGGECYAEKSPEKKDLLGVQFDVKLSGGLNVVDFECRVAPGVSKKIKHTETEINDEIAGRHTRHQLQQMKMTWDVERVSFYVVCNTV